MEAQHMQPVGEPPGLALYRISIGRYLSRSRALAAKLGIADLLKAGPRHYEDLAKATDTHGPSLNRVMMHVMKGHHEAARRRAVKTTLLEEPVHNHREEFEADKLGFALL
jgi:hypothetical protein